MKGFMHCPEHMHSAVGMIALLHRSDLGYMAKELENYGIGAGQFGFLMALYRRDGMRQEELARISRVHRATSARAIQKLEACGYVRRVPDPEDGRALQVYLTAKGRELREVIIRLSDRRTEELFAGFSEEEQSLFLNLLGKMIGNACEEKRNEDTQ
jgi:DNA-binding MarR family transcriptional regulator